MKSLKMSFKERISAAKACKNSKKLKEFMQDRSWRVREVVAASEKATVEILLMAITDREWSVRCTAACNKNATPEVLLKGLEDEDGHVRMHSAHGEQATFAVMFKAIEGEEERLSRNEVKADYANGLIGMISWKLLSKLNSVGREFDYLVKGDGISPWVKAFTSDPLFRLSIKLRISEMGLMDT